MVLGTPTHIDHLAQATVACEHIVVGLALDDDVRGHGRQAADAAQHLLLHTSHGDHGGVAEFLREETGLHLLGQLHFELGIEQRNLADLLQVVLDRVGGGAGLVHRLHGLVRVVDIGDDETLVFSRLSGGGLLDLLLLHLRQILSQLGLQLGLERTRGLEVDVLLQNCFQILHRQVHDHGLIEFHDLGRTSLGLGFNRRRGDRAPLEGLLLDRDVLRDLQFLGLGRSRSLLDRRRGLHGRLGRGCNLLGRGGLLGGRRLLGRSGLLDGHSLLSSCHRVPFA